MQLTIFSLTDFFVVNYDIFFVYLSIIRSARHLLFSKKNDAIRYIMLQIFIM